MKTFISVFRSAACFAVDLTLNSDISVKVKSGKERPVKIGELSRSTGASARSLRYYEQIGLISSERLSNGYRDYDETAAETVETIKSLLDLGFPTTLIERVLPCTGEGAVLSGDCSAITERVTQIRDEMDDKAQRLVKTRDALTSFLERQAS
jgi:DNA-binding transcriptional MerR regulator